MIQLAHLYQALASPCGIVLAVSSIEKAQQECYRLRKESGDPALAGLSFRRSRHRPQEELWIIKTQPKPNEECDE